MESVAEKNARQAERIVMSLPVRIEGSDLQHKIWRELSHLESVSTIGAGFYLSRAVEIGQLLCLTMPIENDLRRYDHDKELYRVWGLVQHCSRVSGANDSEFYVGVAFVGKSVPPSYTESPLHSYRIAGMNEDGTWRIVEAKTSFVVRRHPRYWLALDVMLTAHDADRNLISDETAKTENISLSGAAVFSQLNVDVGDSVNFNSIEHNFSAQAIVRNRQTSELDLPRLHLEFINAEFPIERLKLPNETDFADEED